ncbi:MAG: hypothetical protein ACRD1B_09690 [Thermoanaerobaculia bacterium]
MVHGGAQLSADPLGGVGTRVPARITGRILNEQWRVRARHALYHRPGTWFHLLERFPGALFDYTGYVLFQTEAAFVNCAHLSIGEHVNVPGGIASMPGY